MLYTFVADLVPHAGTAGLLRLVTILHSRCADLTQLSTAPGAAGGMTVTGTVTLSSAAPHTLCESLRRCPVVMDASMEPQPPVVAGPPCVSQNRM